MKNLFLHFDAIMQLIMLLLVLTLGVFILPLLLMIPLGGWQLASALLKGLAWRSRLHLLYFGAAAVYCLALWVGASGLAEINLPPQLEKFCFHEGWLILFVIVIPLAGAIKYYMISCDDCTRHIEQLV